MAANTPAKPPIPKLFAAIAVLFAVVLIGGAYLFGHQLGAPRSPAPTPTPTATTPPQMPSALGDYALGNSTSPSQAAGSQQYVSQGNYTDGTNKLVLLLTRPQQNLEQFMTDAGVTDLQPVSGSMPSVELPSGADASLVNQEMMCGKSLDTGFAACGRIVLSTGQLLYAATDVPTEQVQQLLSSVQS